MKQSGCAVFHLFKEKTVHCWRHRRSCSQHGLLFYCVPASFQLIGSWYSCWGLIFMCWFLSRCCSYSDHVMQRVKQSGNAALHLHSRKVLCSAGYLMLYNRVFLTSHSGMWPALFAQRWVVHYRYIYILSSQLNCWWKLGNLGIPVSKVRRLPRLVIFVPHPSDEILWLSYINPILFSLHKGYSIKRRFSFAQLISICRDSIFALDILGSRRY